MGLSPLGFGKIEEKAVKQRHCLTSSRRAIGCLLLAMAAVLPASCAKKVNRKPIFAVSGKLVDGGQPASRALIVFHPLSGSGRGTLRPVGKVGPDGSFQASTYMANDGAPAGQYALTVVWPKVAKDAPADWDEGPDRLAGRCGDPKKSPWQIRVAEKANDLGTLDLQSWPKPAAADAKTKVEPKPAAETLD
jgi:hypothetical protein